MGFFSSLFSSYQSSDTLGKLIFLFLLFLSCLSWAFFFHRFFLFYTMRKKNQDIASFLQNKSSPLSSPIPQSLKTPFYEIYIQLQNCARQLLQKNQIHSENKKQTFLKDSDVSILESLVLSTLEKEGHFLEKNLFLLPTTITLAPFLGLLGTVWGILLTFSEMNGSTQGINGSILSHLSMALATTVAGLMVAIPSLLFYNYLKNEIEKIRKEMYLFSQNLMIQVELQYRKIEVHEEKPLGSENIIS